MALPLSAGDILIRDVTVIDGTGAPPRSHVSVLIEGERIAAIAPMMDVPASTRTIDGRGLYVIPA